jgi:hypothetical protein
MVRFPGHAVHQVAACFEQLFDVAMKEGSAVYGLNDQHAD